MSQLPTLRQPVSPSVHRALFYTLLVAAVLGLFYLIVMPRGARLYDTSTHAYYGQNKLTETMTVLNRDWDERIIGVSAGAAGIKLTAATVEVNGRAVPLRIWGDGIDFPHGAIAKLQLSFEVTDCASAPPGPLPVSVHLSRFWLVHTETLVDHGADFADASDACGA